jgi:broad specificity phosphatase PhoE
MTGHGRLWLVRHGRTAWNGGRFLGRADVSLNIAGWEQANAAGRLLADESLDRIWTSPLQRARCTATAIAAAQPRRLQPAVSADLLELDCGQWEGRHKGTEKISRRDPHDPIPGGESIADAWRRASRFAETIAPALDEGHRVVVVGHYLTSQLLRAVLLGISLSEALHDIDFRPAAGSVHELGMPIGTPR